jgi:hypothetical protein
MKYQDVFRTKSIWVFGESHKMYCLENVSTMVRMG